MPSIPLPDGLADRDAGVALRRLRARDAAPFARAFADDSQLGVKVGVDQDPTEAWARRFIASQARERARGAFLGLAVTDLSGRPFLGQVMLHSPSWHNRRAEVGFWLVPAARGRGAGTAAVRLLVDWALHELPLDRIELTTTPDNAPALVLAERLGFQREGVMRARNLERGRRVDVVMLARMRHS